MADGILASDWSISPFRSFFVYSLPIPKFQKKSFLSPKKINFKNFQKSRIFRKLKFDRIYYF